MFAGHSRRLPCSYRPSFEALEQREVPSAPAQAVANPFALAAIITTSAAAPRPVAVVGDLTVSGVPSVVGTTLFVQGSAMGTFSELRFTRQQSFTQTPSFVKQVASVAATWLLKPDGTLQSQADVAIMDGGALPATKHIDGPVFLASTVLNTIEYGAVSTLFAPIVSIDSFQGLTTIRTTIQQLVVDRPLKQLAFATDYTLTLRPPRVNGQSVRLDADVRFILHRGHDRSTITAFLPPSVRQGPSPAFGVVRRIPVPVRLLPTPRLQYLAVLHYRLSGFFTV